MSSQEEESFVEEGKNLVIEGVIRSQFGTIPLQAGDHAIQILQERLQKKSKVERRKAYSSSRRMSTTTRKRSSLNFAVATLLGAVIPIAAGLLIFFHLKQLENTLPGTPKISFANSAVKVIREHNVMELSENFSLFPQDKIIVSTDGRAEILYDDGSYVALNAQTEALFYKADNKRKILVLSTGSIFAEISKQHSQQKFQFYTKNALVDVLGTSFDLSAQNQETHLNMKVGKVSFTNLVNHEQQIVKGGEKAVINTVPARKRPSTAMLPKQSNLLGLMGLYTYNNSKKAELLDVNPKAESPLNFEIYHGNPLIFKSKGLIISSDTYFKSNQIQQILPRLAETNEFAIELWVKPDPNITEESALLVGASFSESSIGIMNWAIYLGQSQNRISAVLRTMGDAKEVLEVKANQEIEPITNHLVLQKLKNGQVKLYQNGFLVGEATLRDSLASWNTPMKGSIFFGGTESGSHNWKGSFYMMAFYDRALSEEEINTNYQNKY